ncbi:MAG: polymer-forming cytoskeletal protein [Gammaproteobacteria bacterium]|nr:polymer-forming cytoskeletal protein [Gammaproteobacteria bacterium]
MWGNSKKGKVGKIQTLIGHGTEIKGDISFASGLHLDGSIEGNLLAAEGAQGVVIISEQGQVSGDVHVPYLILNGTVNGDVHVSERIELHQKARVNGNVYYNLMEMSVGAEINGNMVHKKPLQSPRLEHDKDKKTKAETSISAKPAS